MAALIRTGKQSVKKSYCASEPSGKSRRLLENEPGGEEWKTSGMYWTVLDDEEALT